MPTKKNQQQSNKSQDESEEDDAEFFADIQNDLSGLDIGSPGRMSKQSTAVSTSSETLLHHSQLPFVGRQEEMQILNHAVDRVSLEWMENPSEILLVRGPPGVGKSTLVSQASQQGSFWKALVMRGTCEEHASATQPFAALTDVLNDLAAQLLPQSAVWKPRLEEALGGEGPLVATIAPSLCPLLQCQPMEKRLLLQFDTNTPERLNRLGYAIRDMLQAVSDYQPLVMIIDNLHWADPDSLHIWQDLLTTKPLLNFLFLGIHDSDVVSSLPLHADDDDVDNNNNDSSPSPFTGFYQAIGQHPQLRQVQVQPLTKDELQLTLSQVFPYREDDLPDLVDLVFALTKGNPLGACQLLKLWNDTRLITYSSDQIKSSNWEWNRKRLKKEIKKAKEDGLNTYDGVNGIIQARLQALPRKIQFVVLVLAKMQLTQFQLSVPSSDGGAPPDQFYKVFVAAAFHQSGKKERDPITSAEELVKMTLKACHCGILKRNPQSPGIISFTNDLIRTCATMIESDYYEKPKKEKDMHQQALKIELYIATELSRLSAAAAKMSKRASTTSTTPGSMDMAERQAVETAEQQRERYKFLAVDLLHHCQDAMDASEKVKLVKINLEAAEIAIAKSAFHAAITYLERAVAASDVSSRWQPTQYDVTIRIFLFLARMRACCGRNSAATAAIEEIFDNCGSMKDRVFANQVLMVILQTEGKYDKALTKMLDVLGRLGEVFPVGDEGANHLERDIHGLRKTVEKMQNQPLLNPTKMTDKKLIDVMMCLANLAEIGRDAKQPNPYQELAMVRMMKLSIQHGFTRQYPMAFALFAVALIERGHIKEAHRMGQVTEKIARLTDFYGGDAVALFHWHVSHWRRTYKRNLEPVLQIYNAQVDSGDFYHVGFSISTYVQYHLASGFDMDKLADNMELFHGLFSDYNLRDEWQIQIPQQAISALMGETQFPTRFFGVTLAQQDDKLEEFRRAGQQQAIEYLHFLRLFVAFFFHDYEVMQESLDQLKSPVKGVWIPWLKFIQCFLLIQELDGTKGKNRQELKEKIKALKDCIVDWYNDGAPNMNAMASILEAEWIIQKEGLKELSALRVQMMFNEAIDSAVKDGATHLEAFACERAGLHFKTMVVHGCCVDFLSKSHKAYDRCHYIGKVIDLETKYSDILQIANRRVRPASAYLERNATANLRPSTQKIGGGKGEVKTVNVLKGLKKATKAIKKSAGRRNARKANDLFKKDKPDSIWGSGRSKLSLDAGEADPENHPQSPIARMSKRFSRGQGVKDGDNNDGGNSNFSPSPVPVAQSPGSKSPGSKKGRFSGLLFGRRGGHKKSTEEDGVIDAEKEDINDMIESPKPTDSRELKAASDDGEDGIALPFVDEENDGDGDVEDGVSSSQDLKKKNKKKDKDKDTKKDKEKKDKEKKKKKDK